MPYGRRAFFKAAPTARVVQAFNTAKFQASEKGKASTDCCHSTQFDISEVLEDETRQGGRKRLDDSVYRLMLHEHSVANEGDLNVAESMEGEQGDWRVRDCFGWGK